MTDQERKVLLREFQDFRDEMRESVGEIKDEVGVQGKQIAMVKGGLATVALFMPLLVFVLQKATGG